MNQKELKELIEFLIEKDIAEFELERGDLKMRLKRRADPQIVAAPVVAAPAPAAYVAPAAAPVVHAAAAAATTASAPVVAPAEAAVEDESGLHIVRSPIVGTYYESPSPGAPAFVKVGDSVNAGQVLCIVEAMKLMNEIETEVAGEIVKMYAKNAQPVEYGQPLYAIRPR